MTFVKPVRRAPTGFLLMRHTPSLRSALTTAALAGLTASGAVASPVVFSGSGTGTNGEAIAARVAFDLVQHSFGATDAQALQVTVTNTAGATNYRGNAITGLFFAVQNSNLGALGTLDTTATGFDGVANLVRSNGNADRSGVDLGPALDGTGTDGTYALNNLWAQSDTQDNNNYDWSAYDYGLSTIGGGLGGFKGKDINSDDFGIVTAGSALKSGGLNKDAFVDGSATFWIRVSPTLTDVSFIQAVQFGYGSLPDNRLAAQKESLVTPMDTGTGIASPVPEPGTAALWLSALAALAWRQQRHSRRRVAAG